MNPMIHRITHPILMACGAWAGAILLSTGLVRTEDTSSVWVARTMALLTNRLEFTRLEYYHNRQLGIEKTRRRATNPEWTPEDMLSWGVIAARQSDTFYVQAASMTQDGEFVPNPELRVSGQSLDHYWFADAHKIGIATPSDAQKDGEAGDTAAFVKKHAVSDLTLTQQALLLGMNELCSGGQPVATAWNRFTTSTPLGGRGEGVVSETAETIRIDYSLANFDIQFWVELDKPADPRGRFPTRVRRYRKINGKVAGPDEGIYYAFDIGTTNFPKGSRGYVPSMFVDPDQVTPPGAPPFFTLIYKAGEIWQVSRDGKDRIFPPAREPGRSDSGSWKLSLVLFFVANAIGILWYRSTVRARTADRPC